MKLRDVRSLKIHVDRSQLRVPEFALASLELAEDEQLSRGNFLELVLERSEAVAQEHGLHRRPRALRDVG
ncbi:MAG: hypothetical protein IPJ19_13800 [Planctomycetes bacterium]|nr:hypothetical protein [Planctomycetota bacterium]